MDVSDVVEGLCGGKQGPAQPNTLVPHHLKNLQQQQQQQQQQ
jgi:hypothetical protein